MDGGERMKLTYEEGHILLTPDTVQERDKISNFLKKYGDEHNIPWYAFTRLIASAERKIE